MRDVRALALLGSVGFLGGLVMAQDQEPPEVPPVAAAERAFDPAGSDLEAIALVERFWKAMGGKSAYDRIDFFSFTFQVEAGDDTRSRSLLWDRRADRLRVFLKTARGELVVLIDLTTITGVAFENGAPVPEKDMGGVVEYAHRNFWINDFYWLIAPWWLMDPGVHLRQGEDVERDGKTLEQVVVTFDADVEEHAGKTWWLLFDPETALVVEWSWRVPAMPEDQPTQVFAWGEWVEKSGVQFSTVKTQIGGNQKITCAALETPETVDPELFEGL